MKKKLLLATAVVLLLFCGVLGTAVYRSIQQCRTELTTVCYTLEADVMETVRLVQLSDLHGHTFGEDNRDLTALVAAQEPDLILMTGDMLDRSDENAEVVCRLIRDLTEIAPVYYGYGNHEYQWMSAHGESLTPALTEAGAVVLDVEYLDISVKGQPLRIGGYHGYYRQPGMYQITPEQREKEISFCEDFEDTRRYKILLCHIPTAWLDWGYTDQYPVDLVLTGHYHGGQIRLPLVGGVYAPYVGLFPEYTEGIFAGNQAVCILSTGLGSSPGIPRINNLPQITVVDLLPENP